MSSRRDCMDRKFGRLFSGFLDKLLKVFQFSAIKVKFQVQQLSAKVAGRTKELEQCCPVWVHQHPAANPFLIIFEI